MFKGYCMNQGEHLPPVTLESAEEIWNYLRLQKSFQEEIRIVEPSDDAIVAKAKNGKIVFPPQMAVIDIQADMHDSVLGPGHLFNGTNFLIDLKEHELQYEGPAPADPLEAEHILQILLQRYNEQCAG